MHRNRRLACLTLFVWRRVRYQIRLNKLQIDFRLKWVNHHLERKTDFRNWIWTDEKWFFLVRLLLC